MLAAWLVMEMLVGALLWFRLNEYMDFSEITSIYVAHRINYIELGDPLTR